MMGKLGQRLRGVAPPLVHVVLLCQTWTHFKWVNFIGVWINELVIGGGDNLFFGEDGIEAERRGTPSGPCFSRQQSL